MAYSFDISWHEVYTSENIKLSILMISSLHFPYTCIFRAPWTFLLKSSSHFLWHPIHFTLSITSTSSAHNTLSSVNMTSRIYSLYRVYTLFNIQIPFPITSSLQLPLHAVSTSFDFSVSLHKIFHSTWQPFFTTHENQFLFHIPTSFHSLCHPVLTSGAIEI